LGMTSRGAARPGAVEAELGLASPGRAGSGEVRLGGVGPGKAGTPALTFHAWNSFT